MDPSTIIGHASDFTALGFVVWLAHRLTTKTIPELTREFTRAGEQQRQDFKEMLEKQRTDFHDWHTETHAVHEDRMDALVDAVRAVARQERGH